MYCTVYGDMYIHTYISIMCIVCIMLIVLSSIHCMAYCDICMRVHIVHAVVHVNILGVTVYMCVNNSYVCTRVGMV